MKYTQITKVPGQAERRREITEGTMIRLMNQVLINKQCGENNEWHCIYTPDYLKIIRYELIRHLPGKGDVVTHFIPIGEPAAEEE